MDEQEILQILDAIQRRVEKGQHDAKLLEDYFAAARMYGEKATRRDACRFSTRVRFWAQKALSSAVTAAEATQLYDLIGRTYLFEAQDLFDSYCIALEWNRPREKRFYQPRRRVLRVVANDMQDLNDGKLDFLGVSLPPRVGKALADDTPVLTADGWKRHGDLCVGDRVAAPDGRFVKVLAVHPKCAIEYEVEFTNGEKIVCHGNHEWVVFNRHRQHMETLETRAMAADYESEGSGRGHRYFYMLPARKPLMGEEKDLPVKPYTLGVWLGDGRRNNPDICGPKEDCFYTVTGIESDGYGVSWHTTHKDTGVLYYGFGGLREDLEKFGMCHSRRPVEKHIPEIYLTASIRQRLDLLAGLLDTDGTLNRKEHRYMFSTTSERLRDGFIALVSTFGWRCSVSVQEPKLSTSGIQGRKRCWVISFNPTMRIPCRIPRKRLRSFSKPRRIAIRAIRPVEGGTGNCITVDGGMYCAGRTLVPTHNSTLSIMFMTWRMGKYPDSANVMSGHSDKLTDGFFSEVLSILTDSETYRWNAIFPGIKMADKSAKNETVDLNRKKRFPTLTCRSVGGTLTGAVEVGENGILYTDDLIEDLEESLNPLRLESKYNAYLNQLKDRKKAGARELMIGTRWCVLDPLGRIKTQYADNPRYRFRVIPAVDGEGHSNFQYDYGVGFDDAYYADMKESIDDATWCAKYMGSPYVREGLLFPTDELQYFNGVLPDGEPDRKVMTLDIAWGGGDSTAAPIAYVYDDVAYIVDVVFNNGDKTVTKPEVCEKIARWLPNTVRGEANAGGDEYCDSIDRMLRKRGVHVNIRTQRAPTSMSKLGRIIQYAPDIKQFYFLDEKHQDKEYRAFMAELTTFTQNGKNLHDDAPDCLASLADELTHGLARVTVMRRKF